MTKFQELTEEIRAERQKLMAAMQFNNQTEISRGLFRLTVLNARVSDLVMDMLEKERYAKTRDTICPAISADIKIPNDTSMDLECPNCRSYRE